MASPTSSASANSRMSRSRGTTSSVVSASFKNVYERTLLDEIQEVLPQSYLVFLLADLRLMSGTGRICTKFENIALDNDSWPKMTASNLAGIIDNASTSMGEGLSPAQIMAILLLELKTENEAYVNKKEQKRAHSFTTNKKNAQNKKALNPKDEEFIRYRKNNNKKRTFNHVEDTMESLLRAYSRMISNDLVANVPSVERRKSLLTSVRAEDSQDMAQVLASLNLSFDDSMILEEVAEEGEEQEEGQQAKDGVTGNEKGKVVVDVVVDDKKNKEEKDVNSEKEGKDNVTTVSATEKQSIMVGDIMPPVSDGEIKEESKIEISDGQDSPPTNAVSSSSVVVNPVSPIMTDVDENDGDKAEVQEGNEQDEEKEDTAKIRKEKDEEKGDAEKMHKAEAQEGNEQDEEKEDTAKMRKEKDEGKGDAEKMRKEEEKVDTKQKHKEEEKDVTDKKQTSEEKGDKDKKDEEVEMEKGDPPRTENQPMMPQFAAERMDYVMKKRKSLVNIMQNKRFEIQEEMKRIIPPNEGSVTKQEVQELIGVLFGTGSSRPDLDGNSPKGKTSNELVMLMQRAVESREYGNLSFMSKLFKDGSVSQLMVNSSSRIVWMNDWYPLKDLTYAIAVDKPLKRVLVVFRGAITKADWNAVTSFSFAKVENPVKEDYEGKKEKIGVYAGIYSYLFRRRKDTNTDKYDEIANMVDLYGLKKIGTDYSLFVTGHSLGSALARFVRNGPVKAITFGGPCCGGHSFADAYRHQERQGKLQFVRVFNDNDVVPHMPFGFKLSRRGSYWRHVGIGVRLPPVPEGIYFRIICFWKRWWWRPKVHYRGKEKGWLESTTTGISNSFLFHYPWRQFWNFARMHTLFELQDRLMYGTEIDNDGNDFELLQHNLNTLYGILKANDFTGLPHVHPKSKPGTEEDGT